MAEEDVFKKARMELEALYEGVPDDSVNLTFRHLTNAGPDSSLEKEKVSTPKDDRSSPLSKLPSLDFKRGLQAANQHLRADAKIRLHPSAHLPGLRQAGEASVAYNDVSCISASPMQHRGVIARHHRPGIPHSNICAICSTYIYIFRHRCLVCGRVYCRQCLNIGMGEMTEGRKCLECLGKRFSHRYIAKAGDVGCCGWRYTRMVKQAELKWAEKGPRRTPVTAYDRSVRGISASPVSVVSQSQWMTAGMDASAISSPRFAVMSSPAYSPAHRHHIPF